ncbi:hypothetical protein D3273_13415 [Lichenibacterium minor]|uniref:Uncharacterized protein n=1 Tax=Lichenibacterium minor TaxID=2316528 RepID=A0A4Q2U4B9_9HYPH|nr:hypothetical protein [Lichenibacterium minor]RYC31383.1 hypothetical protein D3273_13415 [Lichenibacterium minor]
MPYADTLNALGSDALAPPPGAMAPPADNPAPDAVPAPRSPSAYQGTLDALNAALAPDRGSAPGGDGAPSTLTAEQGSTYGHTLVALNMALSAPAGTRIVMGAAPPVSAGLTPRGATQPDPDSVPPSARLGGGAARDAFDLQAPDADASGGARPLTIRAGQADAPNPDGQLANAPGDGWAAGAAKGAATGVIKGAGDAVGFVGGLGGLADYLIARGESAITGKPVDQVQAAHAARRKAVEADMDSTPLGRLAVATDPTNLLPAPDDVSGPILAKTGAYTPTSEPGRLAQAGVEAAVGAFGPGGGMVSPGTAGRAVAGALARQAPAMAAAGAASQGAVDATGSPLAGLAAGLVVPAAGEAVGAGVRGAAKLAGPVAGGSKLLNAAPVVGPALQAGREAAVAGKILGQSSDPAALRAWAAGHPDAPEVPNSPRTLAGSVGNDPGLFQAEKDARNVNNARPTATVTVDGQSYGGQSFNGIDRAQSDAQVGALQGGRQDADVFRPGAMIRQRMDAIDAAAQQAEDRLNAAHADAVSGVQFAGQGFAADQQSGLAQRTADRQQASADFADQTRAGLADRTADRVQGAADDKAQAQSDRDDAHQQLVQSFADARDRQLGVAQSAAAPLGEPVNGEDLGSTLRGAVEQVRSGAKDLHRDLYKAVDPDGTLALVATPVGDKAGAIMDGLRANGAELSPAEAPLFRRAAALPDVATYGTLHALDTDLSAAMSTERRTAGETSAWGRLSALKGSVKSAMTNAANNKAAHEARMVAAGRMAPEDTIAARLRADTDEWDTAAQQPTSRAATGTGDSTSSGTGALGFSRSLGAEVSNGGGPRNAARDPGLSGPRGDAPAPTEVGIGPRPDAPGFDPDGMRAPPRPDVPRPQDLRAFVKSRGGMRDDGGDLASMGLHELIGRGARAVSPDRMREAAAEAGYLGADTVRAMRETHPNDLLDALSGDRPVHSVSDEDAAAAWQAHDEARERYDAARGEFGTRSKFGVVPERTPMSAYSRDDVEGPSGMPLQSPANSGLQPNFGPEAAGRLRAANAAYAEYAKTYKNPTVGPGLRTVGYSGQYQRGDAAFIKGAVKPGPEGYENARAYLRAAQNDPDAVEAMHDAVLNPLRRAALGPGFLPPAALANWKSSYGPALRALDEVTPGFSRRFDDAGKATQELLDMGAEHKTAIATARGEAARQAIVDNAARKAQLGQANATDKVTVADLLAERAANDKAATQADKASTAGALSDRAASDRAAVAGSRDGRDAGISAARGIVRDAKATPAAQFAKGGGTGVASTEVENAVGSFLKTGTTGATRLRGLVQSVQSDPEALAGLQKAGTDWIVRNHTNADGTLSGAKLISFVKQNGDSLRELYPHDQVSMMGAVARDAEAGARWRTTTAIKGGSDSVKNLLAAASENGQGHHTTLGMVAVEAVAQGFEHGGLQGAAYGGMGAAALYMMNAMRQAGIRRTSDLYIAALADPEVARTLISKMPTKANRGAMIGFSRALKRSLILGPMAVGEARASRVGAAR